MIEINIKNAKVNDDGYGLEVNGTPLETIISNALGTKAGNIGGYNSGLEAFNCNSCDISITIDPHDSVCQILNDGVVFESVEDLMEARRNEYEKKTAETGKKE